LLTIASNFLAAFLSVSFLMQISVAFSTTDGTKFMGGVMKTHFALALVAFCVALAPVAGRTQSRESQPQYSQSQEDQGACMTDALAVCGQFIPDRERVAACLIANSGRISPPCAEAIKRFVPQTAAR
jgi:hypothetical protein